MGRIRILPDAVANQIAAGEVVERPASVVKELLENSLDAGATRVDVHVEGSGAGLLRVADNGLGMDGDDVLLCIERHATSKLWEEGQLAAISTLGFRGEAIPSIASVSWMTILSRPREHDLGTTTIYFVLDAQTRLVNAEADLVNQSVAYRRTLLTFLNATGELLAERGVAVQ